MARCKRCVVKRRRKEEEKRRKKGEIGDQIAKKKKEVCAHLSPLRSRHFFDQSEIHYSEKSTLYLLLSSFKIFLMNKLCDI